MKIALSFFVSLFIVLNISCKHEKKKEGFVAEIPYHIKLLSNRKETDKLWKKAIDKGDTMAYAIISNAYILENRIYELYYYSLIMANKHKCPDAYYHLFYIMNNDMSFNGLSLYSDDVTTRSMALYYLLKSRELGYVEAQYEIDEIFGKGKTVPPSSYYLKKLGKQ